MWLKLETPDLHRNI